MRFLIRSLLWDDLSVTFIIFLLSSYLDKLIEVSYESDSIFISVFFSSTIPFFIENLFNLVLLSYFFHVPTFSLNFSYISIDLWGNLYLAKPMIATQLIFFFESYFFYLLHYWLSLCPFSYWDSSELNNCQIFYASYFYILISVVSYNYYEPMY